MKITTATLSKLMTENCRLEKAQEALDSEKATFEAELKEVRNTIKQICINAIYKFDESPGYYLHIFRRESAVNVSFDNKGISLRVRLRRKGAAELDEEFSSNEELKPITKKLKKILDPLLKEAEIPLVLESLSVPASYYTK